MNGNQQKPVYRVWFAEQRSQKAADGAPKVNSTTGNTSELLVTPEVGLFIEKAARERVTIGGGDAVVVKGGIRNTSPSARRYTLPTTNAATLV